jgi:hypothetical protein
MKLLEADLEFQSTFDDLLQFEEQVQIEEHTRLLLAQKDKEEQAGEDNNAFVVAEDEEFDVLAD